MNLENIKELVKIIKKADYKDFVGALIVNEKLDYLQDLEDLQQSDMDTLESIYNKFMNNDNVNLLSDELLDLINNEDDDFNDYQLEVQSKYDELIQQQEKRGISYGELAYLQSLNRKELEELEEEIIRELGY